MYSYFVNLDSNSRLYSISSGYLMNPARLTEHTTQIEGLELKLCRYDDHESSNLPYDALLCDRSEQRGGGNDAAMTMFRMNPSSAFRGKLGGWTCSGVGIDAANGVEFYFAHCDDRPTPLFPTVRGTVGMRPEAYSHVQLVVKRPMCADPLQLADLIGDIVAMTTISGAWVDFYNIARSYLIDFWNPQRPEVDDATQPDEDKNLLFRVQEFWNGLPIEQLEYFRDPTGLPGNARVTRF